MLASFLLAVLAMGGVVLPAVHRAAHGIETAAERLAHDSAFHNDVDTDEAQEPCPPPLADVDCAVCGGLSAAADLSTTWVPRDKPPEPVAAQAGWIRTVTATGAGARAPPLG